MKRVISCLLMLSIMFSFTGFAKAEKKTSIDIGDYIQMGTYYGKPILWRCVDIDENGPLMLSDKILCLKAFDGAGTNTSGSHGRGYNKNGEQGYYRKEYGSNYWADSNIRDWLNSSASAGNVVWSCGNAPSSSSMRDGYNAYDNEAGFLSNFSEQEKSVMKTITQISLLDGFEYSNTINSNYHQFNKYISSVVQNYDSAYSEQVTDTMFLLDVKQINEVYNNRSILGNDYYIGTPTAEAVANSEYQTSSLNATSKWRSWLRTPNADKFYSTYISFSDYDDSISAYYAYFDSVGVRPAFYLDQTSLNLTGDGTADNAYTFVFVSATGIQLNKNTLSMNPCDTETLTATITPTNVTNKNIIWSSSNPLVATVTNGVVIAKAPGSATITAATADGSKTTTCVVTVTDKKNTIKLGDYIQMGTYYGKPILWRCVDIDENGPLMLSDKILCLKAFDGNGTDCTSSHERGYYANGEQGYYRKINGSNYWADSNIRDWLNSSASAGNVVWSCGNAPSSDSMWEGYNAYDNEAGFLTNFTELEKSAIKTVTQKSLLDAYEFSTSSNKYNSKYHKYDPSITSVVQNYASAYSEQVTDTMFLLDVKQINEVYNNRSILGNEYYIGTPTAEAVANSEYKTSSLKDTLKWWFWLRTPDANNPYGDIYSYCVRYVDSTGDIYDYNAYSEDGGVRPAFYLNLSDLNLEGDGTVNDAYTVAYAAVTDVQLNKSTLSMNPGDTEKLTATITPENATYKNVTWTSSNALVATVTNGVVIAKTPGSATITVTTADGSKTATCVVTVTDKKNTIKLGDYIQMGTYYGKPILWRCVDIDENGPLMLSDRILCLKAFDGKGTNTSGSHGRGYYDNDRQGYYRTEYGSNYWADSNIRDWLNSSASAGNVVWSCGNAPSSDSMWDGYNAYDNEAGFLTNFTEEEKSAMKTVTQKSLLDAYEFSTSSNKYNSKYHKYDLSITSVVQNYASAYSEQVTDTMFLLDVKQINEVYNNRSILGNEYYIGTPTAEAVANSEYKTSSLKSTLKWWFWLRTPDANNPYGDIYSYSVRYVDSTGDIYDYEAYSEDGGVRPAFYLNLTSVNLDGSGSAESPFYVLPLGSKTITCENSAYGKISADAYYNVAGAEVIVNVSPNSGYTIKNVKYNGIEIKAINNIYKFTMPNENVVITAEFEKLYDITISKYINGLLSETKTNKLIAGSEITLVDTKDYADKEISAYVNGSKITPINGVYKLNVPEKNVDAFISITDIDEPKEKQSISISDTDAYKSGSSGGLRFITDITNSDSLEVEYYGTWMIPQELFASHLTDLQAEVKKEENLTGNKYTADLLKIPSDYYDTEFIGISFVKFKGLKNLVLGTKVTSVNESYKGE